MFFDFPLLLIVFPSKPLASDLGDLMAAVLAVTLAAVCEEMDAHSIVCPNRFRSPSKDHW